MISRYEAFMDGTALSSIDPSIFVLDIRPGDVLIYPAKGNKLGHVVMVSEVAKDAKGDIYFQVIQGFTPACELHIVKNNDVSGNSPWFKLDPNADVVKIDNFTFRKDQLRRWK